MPLERLFKENYLTGKVGIYPFTPENLMRVGLALCVYMKLHKEVEKPYMSIEELNFVTLALGVGFMAGGGDVHAGSKEGDSIRIKLIKGESEIRLSIEGLEDYELKMVESILFSRYNMPKAQGEEIGNIWIQEKRL